MADAPGVNFGGELRTASEWRDHLEELEANHRERIRAYRMAMDIEQLFSERLLA